VNLKIFALALAGLAFVAVIAVKAENGVSFDPAAGPEGPGVALGRGTPQGLEAAFAEQNGAGDVHTRKLVLKSVDDGFEPS
jgi:branched-chain amino acid transport system substrate-binding protein